jgi:hypothetical protein
MRRAALFAAALLPLLLPGQAPAGGGSGPVVTRWVVAGGGGRATPSAIELTGTIGQSTVGARRSGISDFCAGYWCGGGGQGRLTLLPILYKNWR